MLQTHWMVVVTVSSKNIKKSTYFLEENVDIHGWLWMLKECNNHKIMLTCISKIVQNQEICWSHGWEQSVDLNWIAWICLPQVFVSINLMVQNPQEHCKYLWRYLFTLYALGSWFDCSLKMRTSSILIANIFLSTSLVFWLKMNNGSSRSIAKQKCR